jgi:hypothetical protein
MSHPPASSFRALLALGGTAVSLCSAAAWADPPAVDLPVPTTAVQPGTSSSPQLAPAAEVTQATAADQGSLQITGLARASAVRTSDFGVDRNGARSGDATQGLSRITAQADLDSGRRFGMFGVHAALGADVATGTFAGRPTLAGDKLPGNRFEAFAPTQAWAGLSVRDAGTLRVGLTTSQWGMGLIANDGNHALDGRRDDWFVLPTTGDRVWRAQLVLQPFGRSHGPLRGLFLAGGADLVREDANAILANGDHAYQGVFAARMFFSKVRSAGLYYVHRDQTFGSGSHPFLRVDVLDGAFDFDFRSAGHGLRVQGEGALILGTTNLAPTPSFPEHDVRQSAGIARARWEAGVTGLRAELDAGWLSGDDNIEDANQNAFKANPNFQQGILMFSQVLGWQSGRARITASDPQYVGYPSADLDRIATGGSVTSAVTVFPKVGWKASEALEVYGGALLAWSPRVPVDPFSTRTVGGGSPRNFLSNAPDGHHLGTEFDLGVVANLAPAKWPVAVAVRAEYGLLLPGGALAGLEADSPIHGGRVTLALLPAAPPH